jgi:hypothetical protein
LEGPLRDRAAGDGDTQTQLPDRTEGDERVFIFVSFFVFSLSFFLFLFFLLLLFFIFSAERT